jgi:hypothetical protein
MLAVFSTNILRELHLDKMQATRRLGHEFGKRDDWYAQALKSVKNDDRIRSLVSLLYVEARLRDMRGQGEGQAVIARNGHAPCAFTNGSAQNGADRHSSASNGHGGLVRPNPSTNRDGAGQSSIASNGLPDSARPARDTNDGEIGRRSHASDGHPCAASSPSVSQEQRKADSRDRQRKASLNVVSEICKSVLDSVKLQDGTAYGDVFVSSLTRRVRTNSLETILFEKTLAYLGGRVPSDARVRDVVPAQIADRLVKEARLAVEASYAA